MTDFKLPIQVLHNGEWLDATVVHFFSSTRAVVVSDPFDELAVTFDHRNGGIRNTPPALVLVAFDRESVPKGALWRIMNDSESWFEFSCYELESVFRNEFEYTYLKLLNEFEHSTDGGATWHRAGRVA